ncbi:hypothetical protein HNR72_008033 [Streptomyces collinus]|jgi:hypothetical protein|uniref:Uncharacterized protein n=1 Tax=Streptomyces collinus TaxID=42684 RepID=A0AA89TLU7_STRCU|nr:hypothetical protein [Streptomyces collinus]
MLVTCGNTDAEKTGKVGTVGRPEGHLQMPRWSHLQMCTRKGT